jgi:hypothetical protein
VSTAVVKKPAYRVPRITRYEEVEVRLDDFETSDILEYLQHRGESLGSTGCSDEGVWVTTDDMARAETLVLIGQREEARLFILGIVGDAMGRKL